MPVLLTRMSAPGTAAISASPPLRPGNVGRDAPHGSARLRLHHRGYRAIDALLLAAVDNHRGAAARETERRRVPDPVGRAGHDGGFPGQVDLHANAPVSRDPLARAWAETAGGSASSGRAVRAVAAVQRAVKRTGIVKVKVEPGTSDGAAGSGCDRRTTASASESSAAEPALPTSDVEVTEPERVIVKRTEADPVCPFCGCR